MTRCSTRIAPRSTPQHAAPCNTATMHASTSDPECCEIRHPLIEQHAADRRRRRPARRLLARAHRASANVPLTNSVHPPCANRFPACRSCARWTLPCADPPRHRARVVVYLDGRRARQVPRLPCEENTDHRFGTITPTTTTHQKARKAPPAWIVVTRTRASRYTRTPCEDRRRLVRPASPSCS